MNRTSPPHRIARLSALAEHYPGDWTPDEQGAPYAELAESRWAAIFDRRGWREADDDADWWVSTRDTLPDALAVLADGVLDGSGPLGVVDLDTGHAHGVHISTPIVSDIGGEGAPCMPWPDAGEPAAIEPGEGATSTHGWGG